MKLYRVTITGADDSVKPEQLVELSLEFPFVEWGLLASEKYMGLPRFPGYEWHRNFAHLAWGKLNVSVHICGRWMRELLVGEIKWSSLPCSVDYCQRVQINFGMEPRLATAEFLEQLRRRRSQKIIFQKNGINDHFGYAAMAYGINASFLFDKSGGAGKLPKSWPTSNWNPLSYPAAGYAGGLRPDNIVAELGKIDAVCNIPFWVDVESGVRDVDNRLDLAAVRTVLEKAKPFIHT